MRPWLALALVIVAAACYAPTVAPDVQCGAEGACPYGLVCDRGRCVVTPGELDAGPGDDGGDPDGGTDAAIDAPPDAPPAAPTWTETTALPSARNFACAVAHGGRIYHVGGALAGGPTAQVLVAPVMPGGALGTWTATAALPAPTVWHACALDAAAGAIYVSGGGFGATPSTAVYRTTIQSDGSVAAWTTLPALPAPRRGHGSAVHGGYLYVFGGEEASGFTTRDTVLALELGNAGATWTTVGTLPRDDYMFGTVATGGRVYLTGGYRGDTAVVVAPLGAGGGFGPAAPGPALMQERERHASVTDGAYVYVLGGEPDLGTANLNTVERAAVLATGSLGSWTSMPASPVSMAYLSAAYWDGRLYLIGGSDDNAPSARVFVLGPL